MPVEQKQIQQAPNPSEAEATAKPELTEPIRVRRFLMFFKSYMSLSTLVIAALPIPAAMLDMIPTYTAHTKLLSVYTSVFCFLLVAFVFYRRHALAVWFFPSPAGAGKKRRRAAAMLPLVFICLALTFAFAYQYTLQQSATRFNRESAVRKWEIIFDEATKETSGKTLTFQEQQDLMAKLIKQVGLLEGYRSMKDELKSEPLENIPYSLLLIGLYLALFLALEAAFVMMALKEYLQDLLGLSDLVLIANERSG